jgi:S-adenosylmethionine:tRNA ribosyltransferase-isomerase
VERYQTVWAQEEGSVAAPTASLHFKEEHLKILEQKGVEILYVTLHVGAGTFLPIDTENIEEFKIHSEFYSVTPETFEKIKNIKKEKGKIWACGTTVVRVLETLGQHLKEAHPPLQGETDIFIKPGFKFQMVQGLLTNFHQPESSLLLLVAAFAGQKLSKEQALQKIITTYHQAVEKEFRLFSYGDLTVIS